MMATTVDTSLAAWLKSEGLFVSVEDAGQIAKWADRAKVSTYMSSLAGRGDALKEAERQLAFLAGPIAIDEHVVEGLQSGLVATSVRMRGDQLGYQSSPSVFVIGAQESETVDLTTLTVLYLLPKAGRVRRLVDVSFDFTAGALPVGATLARNTIGTRVAANGRVVTEAANVARFDYSPDTGQFLGLLVEPRRRNLSPAAPTAGSRLTVEQGVADPAGGMTANRYVVNGGTDPQAGVGVTVSPAGRTYTRSMYIRTANAQGMAPRTSSFDYGLPGTTEVSQVTFTPSNLWKRYTATRTYSAGSSATSVYFRIDPFDGAGGTNTPAAGASQDSAFWQYEEGATATSYIPAGQTRAADTVTLDFGRFGVADGPAIVRYTFDDMTVQDVPTTIAGGRATVPLNLNRPWLRRADLLDR